MATLDDITEADLEALLGHQAAIQDEPRGEVAPAAPAQVLISPPVAMIAPAAAPGAGKSCSACGVRKPLDEFGRDPRARDGRQYKCKPCAVEYARKYRTAEYQEELRRKREEAAAAKAVAEEEAAAAKAAAEETAAVDALVAQATRELEPTRVCSDCGEAKPISAFVPRTKRDGHYSNCRPCRALNVRINKDPQRYAVEKRQRDARRAARDAAKAAAREERLTRGSKVCPSCQIDKPFDDYYRDARAANGHSHYCKTCHSARAKARLPEVLIKSKERYHSDPIYRLVITMRTRVRDVLRMYDVSKAFQAYILLGCSKEYYAEWIASQFTPPMTWQNYGRHKVWEVDHIRPCASFNLSDPLQQAACFSWKNCRPMLIGDNRAKKDRMPPKHVLDAHDQLVDAWMSAHPLPQAPVQAAAASAAPSPDYDPEPDDEDLDVFEDSW